MVSLVKDLSDGVRLIQLMVSTITSNGHALPDLIHECYRKLWVSQFTPQCAIMGGSNDLAKAILLSDDTTKLPECAFRKPRMSTRR